MADDPFDRQRRIGWWDQSVIERARILICGAGAIGTETTKDLVLLGFRDITIWDLDTIEHSNLSRTVLFRSSDVGRHKAVVAAERVRELSLSTDCHIEGVVGDVVWELGLGTVRRATIVLGCLDNVEARRALNRFCKLAGRTFIDAGIVELESRVSVFAPGDAGCYECGLSKHALKDSRRRYSCGSVMRDAVAQHVIPSVVLSAALCGALQAQEAVKALHGLGEAGSYCVRYSGITHNIEKYLINASDTCDAHMELPEPRHLGADASTTLDELLAMVCDETASGAGAELDLSADREYLADATCATCGAVLLVRMPAFHARERDLRCPDAEHGTCIPKMISRFSLDETGQDVLTLRLADIGIPRFHVLPVRRVDGDFEYYELSG